NRRILGAAAESGTDKAMTLFDWAAHQTQYPARKRDPVTSFQAAEQIGQHVTHLEAAVLDALKAGPAKTEELTSRLGISLLTLRPRMRQVELKKKVRRAGTRANSSGRQATIWERATG